MTYRDSRIAGAVHAGLLIGAVGLLGLAAQQAAAHRGRVWSVAATAAATWVSLGGTSLARTGLDMSELLETRRRRRCARRLLPSLCGRDPAALDGAGLTRAALESVAENTSDAQVAPLLWAAVGGVPAVLVYRGINTLDSMIGHRSPRYLRFGWAAAQIGRLGQLRRRARDRGAGGVAALRWSADHRPVRRGPGAAMPPVIRAPTPASSRRPSPGRSACAWAGPRSTTMSCRSGPHSATAGSRR